MEAYLDNSATTRCFEAVKDIVVKTMTEDYGNPSAMHQKGVEAENYVKEAVARIARTLKVQEKEIYFTSGGTEANNIAVFGAAAKNKKIGNRIVTTAIEHSSVMDSTAELERLGFEVVRIAPDTHGHISSEQVCNAINSDTILVTMMMVNNEVGSILPIEAAVKAARKIAPRALVHCDCVQAFGKIPINAKRLGADMITVSAHKICSPKGVGALYKRKGLSIPQRTFGGHQEDSFRPGTEAAPLIAAFGTAAGIACSRTEMNRRMEHVQSLNDYAVKKLSEIDGVAINSPSDALPYIINFSTCCVKAETMLNYLSGRGIYVSGGSACAKGEPSHVIKALNLPHDAADSAIRVSFSADNTTDDIDELVRAVKEGIATLAHFN